MKVTPSSIRRQFAAKPGIFLLVVAFLVATVGYGGTCGSPDPLPPSENLEIRTWHDLDAVRDNLAGTHKLMNDLDSTTSGYGELASPAANGGKGWQPIGPIIINYGGNDYCYGITGTFDGQGYEIHDLVINRPDESYVGLFGKVDDSGLIKDIGVMNITVIANVAVGGLVGSSSGTVSNSYSNSNITGYEAVGGLVGSNAYGTVSNSYFTGNVLGEDVVGGLVGLNKGTISNSYSGGIVMGDSRVGGLVGSNHYATVNSCHSSAEVTGNDYVGGLAGCNGIPELHSGERNTVSDSYSTGIVIGNNWVGGLVGYSYQSYVHNSYSSAEVTGHEYIGGLVGQNDNGAWISGGSDYGVSDCYSTGIVTGYEYVGGLVAQNNYSSVNNSYSTATVTGVPASNFVGGLVGRNYYGTVSDAYFSGSVTGYGDVGGLVGQNYAGTVSSSYSKGYVGGTGNVGGLVGKNSNYGTVSNSFWDIETSGQATSDGGTGKNTTDMQDIITFSEAGWNIIAVSPSSTNTTCIWNIVDDMTYPFLSWQP